MKILFVTLDPIEASSSAMMSNVGIVSGLIENGHEVDILTVYPNVNTKINFGLFDSNIKVFRLGASTVYNALESGDKKSKLNIFLKNVARRMYKKFSLYNNTYFVAKNANISVLDDIQYDLVISASDPKTSHLVVLKLKKQGLNVKKWIQYWGDPMSADITNSVALPNWYIKKIEKKYLKAADGIIYVSPFTLDLQKQLFPVAKQKMSFLPIPFIPSKTNTNNNMKKLKLSYLGSYYKNIRSLKPLYNTVENLNEVELIIAGSTDEQLISTNNITVYPNLPLDRVIKIEDESNVIVCVLNKRGTQIPGKLYHYAGTNKAILIILDGEHQNDIRSYLEQYDRFIFCNNEETDIKRALHALDSLREFSPSAMLSPNRIAKDLIKIIE